MAAKEVTTRDASGSVGSAVSHASAANPALGEVQRLVDELVDALEGAKGQGTDIAIEPLTSVRVETKVLRRRLENLCKAIGARGLMSAGAARDELGQALGYEQDETTKVWWGQCRDCGGWKASVGLTSYSCETCGAMTHKQASLKFGGPTTSSVLKLVQGGPGRTVPAPAAPMPVARELVKDLYTESVGLVLRYHRGDFYRYEGKCWPEMDRDSLRADAYRWLDDAVYEKEVKGRHRPGKGGTPRGTRSTT